jgi:hypothetical protein
MNPGSFLIRSIQAKTAGYGWSEMSPMGASATCGSLAQMGLYGSLNARMAPSLDEQDCADPHWTTDPAMFCCFGEERLTARKRQYTTIEHGSEADGVFSEDSPYTKTLMSAIVGLPSTSHSFCSSRPCSIFRDWLPRIAPSSNMWSSRSFDHFSFEPSPLYGPLYERMARLVKTPMKQAVMVRKLFSLASSRH